MPVPNKQAKKIVTVTNFTLPDVDEIFANAKGSPDLAIRMALDDCGISPAI